MERRLHKAVAGWAGAGTRYFWQWLEAYSPELGRRLVAGGLAAFLGLFLLGPAARELKTLFVIPDDYVGQVRIEVAASCPTPPIRNSRRVFTVGSDGTACVNRGVSLHWCGAEECQERLWTDKWVRAGQPDTPLRTWGEQPQVVIPPRSQGKLVTFTVQTGR